MRGNVNLNLWADDEIAKKFGFDAFEGMVTNFTDSMTRDQF